MLARARFLRRFFNILAIPSLGLFCSINLNAQTPTATCDVNPSNSKPAWEQVMEAIFPTETQLAIKEGRYVKVLKKIEFPHPPNIQVIHFINGNPRTMAEISLEELSQIIKNKTPMCTLAISPSKDKKLTSLEPGQIFPLNAVLPMNRSRHSESAYLALNFKFPFGDIELLSLSCDFPRSTANSSTLATLEEAEEVLGSFFEIHTPTQ